MTTRMRRSSTTLIGSSAATHRAQERHITHASIHRDRLPVPVVLRLEFPFFASERPRSRRRTARRGLHSLCLSLSHFSASARRCRTDGAFQTELYHNNLVTIPPEIGDLRNLSVLD
jgi:Leucine-rich repeat (LRR) protein